MLIYPIMGHFRTVGALFNKYCKCLRVHQLSLFFLSLPPLFITFLCISCFISFYFAWLLHFSFCLENVFSFVVFKYILYLPPGMSRCEIKYLCETMNSNLNIRWKMHVCLQPPFNASAVPIGLHLHRWCPWVCISERQHISGVVGTSWMASWSSCLWLILWCPWREELRSWEFCVSSGCSEHCVLSGRSGLSLIISIMNAAWGNLVILFVKILA